MSSINNYNRVKRLNVRDISGTPTIERTVPIKIVGGDDSTTGTGDIVLDWTNISSKSDIAVYDENNNLFDYYFESFDATNEKAVIWVYRDWVRDGSTQAQIAYGDGPSDQSVDASTVFDKESDLEAGYLFNESSGDLLDVTSNDNDGTVNGATREQTGIVNGAYSFDGSDDYIEIPHDSSQNITGQISIFAWIDINSLSASDKRYPVLSKRGGGLGSGNDENSYYFHIGDANGDNDILRFGFNNGDWHGASSSSILSTGKQRIGVTFDESEVKFYLNGSLEDTVSLTEPLTTYSVPLYLGVDPDDKKGYFTGILDNVELYNKIVSEDEETALYDATKSSPDFFSQQAGEEIKEGAWYNSSWDYRRKFTSDNTKVEASYPYALILDLSQFPSDFFSKIQSGGEDIRITKADGETEVARGVREVDTTGEKGLVYFYADGISTSSDTDFYIYYGNSGASDHADDATYGMENVFSSDYKFYSTMADLTTSSIKDETSNNNNGTKKAPNEPNEVTGEIGKAQDFDGDDDYISFGDKSAFEFSSGQSFSFCWWKSDVSETKGCFFTKGYGDPIAGHDEVPWYLSRTGHEVDNGSAEFFLRDSYRNSFNAQGISDTTGGNWFFVVAVYNSTEAQLKLYIDGVLEDTVSDVNEDSYGINGEEMVSGVHDDEYGEFSMDEFGILNTALTADEITTIYNNQSSNSTFWTVGSEETEEPIITSTGFMAFM